MLNEQYLRLNVMKLFICMNELETKILQPRNLASLQINVHYCKVDLKYFSSSTRYNLHSSLTKIFLLNDFFSTGNATVREAQKHMQ